MESIFRKLIKKEFGANKYESYFQCIRKNKLSHTLERNQVYLDIYTHLNKMDIATISKMHDRLNEAMVCALRIHKTFIFALFVYLAAVIFLIASNVLMWIMLPAIALLTFCFIGKTYEFLINKYCFIDAQIILLYRSAMEKILLSRAKRKAF